MYRCTIFATSLGRCLLAEAPTVVEAVRKGWTMCMNAECEERGDWVPGQGWDALKVAEQTDPELKKLKKLPKHTSRPLVVVEEESMIGFVVPVG